MRRRTAVRVLAEDGDVTATAAGRGWLRVPRTAWDAFLTAVKRGDLDDPRTLS